MRRFGLGVWSHHIGDFGSEDEIDEHASRLSNAGFDLLIVCVKSTAGAVSFLTDLADVEADYPRWDPLKVLIQACGERGVKVHPWFCVFTEGEQSKLLRMHPEYAARFESTRPWACACRPEVQDYVYRLYEDVAARYRPAGLHLDYIRTGGVCKCEYCRSQMCDRGVDVDSMQPRDPAYEAWVDWRMSRINHFVSEIRDLTIRRSLELSAAVFAGYPDSVRTQAQDWLSWAEQGLVDYLFPMNYTNSLRVAVTRTTSHLALVGGRVPVWEGLGKSSSGSQLTTQALSDQIRGVVEAGADGVVLFHYGAVTDADIEAIDGLRKRLR